MEQTLIKNMMGQVELFKCLVYKAIDKTIWDSFRNLLLSQVLVFSARKKTDLLSSVDGLVLSVV